MKKISLLGSTGSIGRQVLEVIRQHKSEFSIETLAVKKNIDLLEKQITEFSPRLVVVFDEDKAEELQRKLPSLSIVSGIEGLIEAATLREVDLVIAAMTGMKGIIPIISAIKERKTIGIANKELLVSAGQLITSLAKEYRVDLLPIDSEHNGLFQCLEKKNKDHIRRLILTASGGPFYHLSKDALHKVTLKQALCHPTYSMGVKNTIDSSTLMNKGLEVIEAFWLFNVPLEKIEVVVHPQSIVHAIVEWVDGSMLASMSEPNMKIPIQHVLFYPQRGVSSFSSPFDCSRFAHLDFYEPEKEKFPCLALAYEALKIQKSMPAYMNAANEVLVDRFAKGEIPWLSIGEKLRKLMTSHRVRDMLKLDILLDVDREARETARIA